jgi:hypothetical protein
MSISVSARNPIKPIETSYRGYRFRSRLEARYAVYFDAIGIWWEYEKEGYDLGGSRYLPDFWLPEVNMWAEVKPSAFTGEELMKVERLSLFTDASVVLLVGPPAPHSYWCIRASTEPVGERDVPDDWYEMINSYVTTNLSDDPAILGVIEKTDVVLDSRYLDEHRFYQNTGFCPETSDLSSDPRIMDAVYASRGARFEFGEQG